MMKISTLLDRISIQSHSSIIFISSSTNTFVNLSEIINFIFYFYFIIFLPEAGSIVKNDTKFLIKGINKILSPLLLSTNL